MSLFEPLRILCSNIKSAILTLQTQTHLMMNSFLFQWIPDLINAHTHQCLSSKWIKPILCCVTLTDLLGFFLFSLLMIDQHQPTRYKTLAFYRNFWANRILVFCFYICDRKSLIVWIYWTFMGPLNLMILNFCAHIEMLKGLISWRCCRSNRKCKIEILLFGKNSVIQLIAFHMYDCDSI